MAHAYTPGLQVTEKTIIRKRRVLPLKGDILVTKGTVLKAEDIVARTELPGKVRSTNVVNKLGIQPQELRSYMLKKEGDPVKKNEPIAEAKSFITWFGTVCTSPITGTVESVSTVTGQVLFREPPRPVQVHAYIDGKVIETIENEGVVMETFATFIQGIFGVGGEVTGELAIAVDSPDEVLGPDKITEKLKDKIIVGGSLVRYDTIESAKKKGVKAIIFGGIYDEDLKEILGYDLGVAITGSENIGITLIVTEGFGQIGMAHKTFELLKSRAGSKASVNGATQIRAGVVRPEIIIPYALENVASSETEIEADREGLKANDIVRVIREPFFGRIGKVKTLPSEPQQIETESKV
ncbi:MAG: hypothetical protein ACUZ77_04030, partial [Candidatus Brocadiales bacterium]